MKPERAVNFNESRQIKVWFARRIQTDEALVKPMTICSRYDAANLMYAD